MYLLFLPGIYDFEVVAKFSHLIISIILSVNGRGFRPWPFYVCSSSPIDFPQQQNFAMGPLAQIKSEASGADNS